MRMRPLLPLALAATLSALVLTACGGGGDGGGSGTIRSDGSSTVGPLMQAAAERFQRERSDVRVTVGISGTGGGFERFCAGETDISNASRPIEDEEKQSCSKAGVEFVELPVANDALTVVVNSENDWADCLTTAQLKTIWKPGSKVDSWKDVDPSFPDEPMKLYGPGTDSGTFDYFTSEINGEEGASRPDYSASEDDNVIVRGVQGDKGALGYFGFTYFEENEDTLKAVGIDSGDGCVQPSMETAQSGRYTPLSRPLFIYVKKASLSRSEVKDFVSFTLDNADEIAGAARYIPPTEVQLSRSRAALANT
ncbi:MAG TPA: PstS family phosphate ABC transporter substrate-binding protein [Gaiellaceae bacterium]|nr:PstS family phosphate ABC transporter substrate-binding protein [Gaiellaceae bacterium]